MRSFYWILTDLKLPTYQLNAQTSFWCTLFIGIILLYKVFSGYKIWKLKLPQNLWKVLKRNVSGRWALGIGRPPVPRVHSLSWKASNGSLVPWAQWDKGTVPKSLGWGLSTCHPFTLPQIHNHDHSSLTLFRTVLQTKCSETKTAKRNMRRSFS